MLLLRRFPWVGVLLFFCIPLSQSKAQCPNDNVFLADLTPAYVGDTAFHTCVQGGQYITTSVMAGNTYIFSTCGQSGFDTQITLRNAAGNVWYAFNDNFCGQQSQITWLATFTGTVKLLVDEAPSCSHNTTCQLIRVREFCNANAGTVSTYRNGSPHASPIYLCEGKDTASLVSNNDYTLPPSATGEQAEMMYMVYSCPVTSPNPYLDSCFTGVFLPSKNFTDANPGVLSTGLPYYLVPVVVDDGDNAGNPNGMINIDLNGDSCYSIGTEILVYYLNPLAFASNIDCSNRSVLVEVFGGRSEVDSSFYTITNTGAGIINSVNVRHGSTVEISGLFNGDMYSFQVSDANGCVGNFSGGPFYSPFAGNDTALHFCESAAPFHIDDYLTPGHDTTGIWLNPSNVLSTDSFTPGFSLEGIWKYIVDGAMVCENDTSYIDINIDSLYSPGINVSTTICQYDSMVNLWNVLSPAADTTGSFMNGPITFNGILVANNSFTPTRNYKYVVNIGSSCPRDSVNVRVYMKRYPVAGRDTSISFCSDLDSIALLPLIPGSPHSSGSWFNPFGTGFSGNLHPATDSSGIYKYLVPGAAPCPSDSSEMTVSYTQAPNAGPDSSVSFCQNTGPVALSSLLPAGIVTSGSWFDSNDSLLPGGMFNPGTDNPGTFIYILNGVAPCSADSANWQIQVVLPPNPGSNDSLTFCDYNASISLNDLLSMAPDTNGTWYNPSSVALTGSFNPSVATTGLYTYVVPGTSPCASEFSLHYIEIFPQPNPGIGSTVNYCSNHNPINLFSAISSNPQPGGSWLDPSMNATVMPFIPGSSSEGNYTYTISGNGPCKDSSTFVSVNVEDAVNPGTDSGISVCTIDSVFALFGILGGNPDTTGSWYNSNWQPSAPNFDPGTQTTETFHYLVSATAPCLDSSASVTVQVFNAANPGASGNLTICSNQDSILLFNLLSNGPDTYGSWKDPYNNPHTGILFPGMDSSGIYVYTVPATGSCHDSSSTVQVNITRAPNPGMNDSAAFCSNAGPALLLPLLGGTPDASGSWTDPNSNLFTGPFIPASSMSGIYTYTVPGTAPCLDSSAQLKITVKSFANPGTNGSVDVCETDAPFSLLSVLTGSPQTSGSWQNSSYQPVSGNFNPATDTSAWFIYTVHGNAPCPDSSAIAQVQVMKDVNAGRDTSLRFCSNETALNIFNLIPGSPQSGGSWTAPGGILFNGVFNPGVDSGGVFQYHVSAQAPCPNKMSVIDITVKHLYRAGSDADLTVCANEPTFNFFTKLKGQPDINGFWRDPQGFVFNGYSDNVDLISGDYFYIIAANPPCPADSAKVALKVNAIARAGDGKSVIFCENANPVSLMTQLSGNPDSSGLWFSPGLGFSGGFFNPASDEPGVYTYVVQGNYPCRNDSAFVSIDISALPDAGPDQELQVCYDAESTNLYKQLQTPGDPGGFWIDPMHKMMNGIFIPGKNALGKYQYVIPENQYCPGDTMEATVSISTPFNIDAGRDVVLLYGERKYLTANSFEAKRYHWFPEEGLSNAEIASPEVFCENSTTYIVRGYDEFGCSASDTVEVSVYANIFIPNSFTPNHDGLNDDWKIPGLEEYDNFTIVVLNNVRSVVFQSSTPGEWWDGTYQGEYVPSGQYYYRIEFHDKVRFSDLSGILNVIR